MTKPLAVAAIAAILFTAAPAYSDEKTKAELETFMKRYLVAWNAHDAAVIVKDFYRLSPTHPWSNEAGLRAEFERLKSQGYVRSETSSIKGCVLGPDTGRVELRYTRLKADGTFLPPKDRASLYELKLFADGWRATSMRALPAGEAMECPVRN